MDIILPTTVWLLTLYTYRTNAVPPEACFANFRWDDCGKPPTPVMYYWKSGSRCEVGLWRGCLPNMNMFADEYECVSTCIMASRARPDDFHSQYANQYDNMIDDGETTTMEANVTDYDVANQTNKEDLSTVDPTGDSAGDTGSTGDPATEAGGQDNTSPTTLSDSPAEASEATTVEAAPEAE